MYTLSLDTFFLNTPLYEEIKIDDLNVNTLLNLLFHYPNDEIFYSKPSLNCYCKICDEKVCFSSISNDANKEVFYEYKFLILENNYQNEKEKKTVLLKILQNLNHITRFFKCSNVNDHSHDISFIFKVVQGRLYKIGQYPSVEELKSFEHTKIKKLTKEIFKDLNKAYDLFTQGVWHSAYIFLSEILEHQIITPKFLALEIPMAKNKHICITEKMLVLKDILPETLLNDKVLTTILKKNPHKVTINECKYNFEIIYYSILIILENELSQKK